MDKTDKLEACPFCGANAFMSWDGDVNSPDDWSANCDNTLDCGATVGGMSSEDAARTAWNTRSRASVAALPPDVDFSVDGPFEQTVDKYRGELWIDNEGFANFRFHIEGGDFTSARGALVAFIEVLQKRLASEQDCPFYSPVAAIVDAEKSSRHPHYTHADDARLQELLDALPEIPSEEEAEAVLQAAGTSGKEVANGFIEKLLRENLELKTKLNTARHYFCSCGGALTAEEYIEHYFEKGHDRGEPQLLFKAAAAEISSTFGLKFQEASLAQVAAIIAKHLGSAAVGEQGESGWLLEKMHNGNVHYICADYVLEWTDDPNKALRLSRREDAEALCTIVEDCEKIASHEWVPATPTSTQT